jgi:hypothetical protein
MEPLVVAISRDMPIRTLVNLSRTQAEPAPLDVAMVEIKLAPAAY